jgi:hypothetical protein
MLKPDRASVERFKIALLKHINRQVSIRVITPQKADFLREKVSKELRHDISAEAFADVVSEINKDVRLDFDSLIRYATGQVN